MFTIYNNKCRICLENGLLISIFHDKGLSTISAKIMSLAKIDITTNDGLPDKICKKCIRKLDDCINFIELCEHSDSELRRLMHKDTNSNNDDMWIEMNSNHINKYQGSSPDSDHNKCLLIDDDTTFINGDENSKVDSEMPITKNHKKSQKQQCFTCGKVMSSRFRLKTHLRTHTGERPYSCPHCGKNFSLSQNLKVHMRVHTGEKPLECSFCGESFAQSAGLAAHKRKHTGQTPYRCLLCPRSFRTVGHLQYHTRRHTGEKNFECESCHRSFITRSDLKQHLLTHTGDRPHVCCICGLRLSRASHLKRHVQHIHNNQNLLTCPDCTISFKDKDELEKHKTMDCNQRNKLT